MHFLITGGCGFIGSHLAHALIAAGHSVRILDNLSSGSRENAPAASEVIIGDIADEATVAGAVSGVDGIFHLAAIASVQQCNNAWLETHRTNVTGTITVFEAALKAPQGAIPVVYASSAAVYGDNPALPLSEDSIALPLTSYGQDKLAAEQYARVGAYIHALRSVGLRFFNVYGPGQNPASPYSGVISRFIDAAKKKVSVTFFGDGEQTRDFIYVTDITALLIASMHHALKADAGNAVFNGATGRATSLLTLLSTIESVAGHKVERKFDAARTGDIRHSLGNPNHARQILGFEADTSLEQGLHATYSTGSVRGAYV